MKTRVIGSLIQAVWRVAFWAGVIGSGLITTVRAQDTWTAGTIRPTSSNLYGVTFAGQWVAVGQTGRIMTSPDGATWTVRASGTTAELLGVAYGSGRYVVVGSGGTIRTSDDGISWTARVSGTGNNLYAVRYAGGQFIATGIAGTLLTSLDGITWTPQVSGLSDQSLLGIAHNGSLYVVVGSNGSIITSPNGATWTPQTSGVGAWLYGVAFGNGRFVAVTNGGNVIESTNGANWAPATVNWSLFDGVPQVEALQGVTFGGNRFVITGFHSVILQGTGGGSAYNSAFYGSQSSAPFSAVAHSGSLFVAVGDFGSIYTSTDGITWSGTVPLAISDLTAITSSGASLLAVGSNNGQSSLAYRTTNGTQWAAGIMELRPNGVVFGGSQYLAVGLSAATSPDGVTWTHYTIPGISATPFRDVAYGFGHYVAVGQDRIVSSPNGATWTDRSSGLVNASIGGITAGPSLFVAVGGLDTAGLPGAITTSPNGTTWTPRSSGILGNPLNAVVYGGGQYVAVGDAGVVTTSPDGITWTPRGSVTTANLLKVTYTAHGRFVAVGSGGAVMVSSNGISWSPRSSGTSATLNSVATVGTLIVAVGPGEVVTRSTSEPISPPAFTVHPQSQSIAAGQDAQFNAVASGSPAPTYQWQISTNSGSSWNNLIDGQGVSGATTTLLVLSAVAQTSNGHQFRCVATNPTTAVNSQAAILTVTPPTPVVFTSHPANQNLTAGQTANFSVTVTGSQPLSYQWQRQPAGSQGWQNLTNTGSYSGTSTANLGVTGTTVGMSGDQFRCFVSNAVNQATSNPALLTINAAATPPSITLNPNHQTVTEGQSATFSVTASGSAPLSYQWQRLVAGTGAWGSLANNFNYSGVTTSTLLVTGTTTTMTGDQFRCMVTNSLNTATSSPATLTVNPNILGPTILTHPASQSATAGQGATFTVSASGTAPLAYQWERRPAGLTTWSNLVNGTTYSGVTTAVLTVAGTTVGMSGDQFRCRVSNAAGPVTSNAATLTVTVAQLAPTILTDPSNQTATVGQSAGFSVSASGTAPLSYQWQRTPAGGGGWSNVANGASYSGATTASLTVIATTLAMSGDQFRCVVTNSLGTANSLGALLTVNPPNQAPVFTQHPVAFTGNPGQTATFTVAVTGNPTPAIQWQVSADNGLNWANMAAGGNGLTLTLTPLFASQNGYRYRALATNSVSTATSNSALLSVVGAILPTAITTQPLGGSFRSGQTVFLSAAVSGSAPFQYQWFKDGLPVSGATGPSYAIPAVGVGDAGAYHLEVTGAGGGAASLPATVVVLTPPQFLAQPLDALAEVGLSGGFSALLTGSPLPTVQWFGRIGQGAWLPLSEESVVQANTPTVLVIDGVTASQHNLQVQARAYNSVGSADSTIALLQVSSPTTAIRFLDQPDTIAVRSAQPFQFAVEMEGSGPFTFQWRKDGVTLPGKTTRICALSSAAFKDGGGYSVIVRNATGGSATSNTAFLTVAGAVEGAFDPRGGPNGEVTVMLSLIDGGFLSAGSFTRVAGVPRPGLVKLLQDGSVDLDFDPGTGPNGPVQALVELADSKFLVVGQFDRYNGTQVPGVVRVDAFGKLDSSFVPVLPTPTGPGGGPIPVLERFHFAALSLNGGGYLLGGRAGMVALTPAGAAIPQSVFYGNGGVFALLQQYDGKIVVGGDFSLLSGFPRPRLARLSPSWALDPDFNVGTGPNAVVHTLLRAPAGSMYVMGRFTSFDGQPRPSGIAQIQGSGALVLTFNPALQQVVPANDLISTAATGVRPSAGRLDAIRAGQVQPNGGLVVSNGSGATQNVVAIDPSGVVSNEVNVPVQGSANALAITDDEHVAVGGVFSSIAGTPRNSVGVFTDASDASRLVNLSCRARVTGGSNVLIFGFVIRGPESMRVLIRGIGPSLRLFNLTDVLARPLLTVFNSNGAVIAENRSWRTVPDPIGLEQVMAQVGAFPLSFTDDTALVLNLAPGGYTAHISSQTTGQGVALGEIYAVDQGRSRLVNSSVRGAVGTGNDVLIPGFVIAGGPRLMLLRAAGPALIPFGVSGALANPLMELRRQDSSTLLASNQGWASNADFSAVQVRSPMVGAFAFSPQSADSAVLKSLDAGAHTVLVRGADGGTGIALVEVYDANGVDPTTLNQ